MSAYSTRTITRSAAEALLTRHYANELMKVKTMSDRELGNRLDVAWGDSPEYLLTNFDVLPDEQYQIADITQG